MCGRYYIDIDDDELKEIVMVAEERVRQKYPKTEDIKIATGEIFPTNIVPVYVLDKGRLAPVAMRWTFPGERVERTDRNGRKYAVIVPYTGEGGRSPIPGINARVDTALRSRPGIDTIVGLYSQSLEQRRIAVPTSGFYEWTHEGKKTKDKFLFTEPGKPRLYLAGIYSMFSYKQVQFPHFSILTTNPPADFAEKYHDRSPVLLEEDEVQGWIDGSLKDTILHRTPFALDATMVG